MAKRNVRQSAIDAVEEESDGSGSGDDSDASSSYDDDSDDEDEEEDEDEEDKNEAANDELKHASVRADIEEMQRMVGEMDKMKQRLQFRLEHVKHVRMEEEAWQKRQQLEAKRQQEEQERAARIKQQHQLREAQVTASVVDATGVPLSVAGSSFTDVGVQTEFLRKLSHVEHSQPASRMRDTHSSRPPATTSERPSAVESTTHASAIPAQDQSARLSLLDLGKSYGMKASRQSPTQRASHHHQPPSPLHDESYPAGSHDGDVPAVLPEASESYTFFIRRDSSRTSGRVDPAAHHIDGFEEEQQEMSNSMADSFVRSDNAGSPVSARSFQGHNSRAFQTLRNSILSSIGEADVRSSADASHKPYYSRSLACSDASVRAAFDADEATKTDGQREREAIQSLLFSQ